MTLLSFHGKKTVKAKYLRRVRAHAKADEIIKGKYWENGRGCAVGCTIHGSDHAAYETELGIPEWLARLEDTIFEQLPNGEAKAFPEAFLSAIPIGVDLRPIRHRFCAYLMQENLDRVEKLGIADALKLEVTGAIRRVMELHVASITDPAAESAAESAVWSAAWSAAESAESAERKWQQRRLLEYVTGKRCA